MAKRWNSKKIVIYALVGLGILYVFWPAIKGFFEGITKNPEFNQPGWY